MSSTEEAANAIWDVAKEQAEDIQAKAHLLADLDADMLKAVLKEHQADSPSWMYIQRMDDNWILNKCGNRFNKCQPPQQLPRNVLGDDGKFTKLPDQCTNWRLTNQRAIR